MGSVFHRTVSANVKTGAILSARETSTSGIASDCGTRAGVVLSAAGIECT